MGLAFSCPLADFDDLDFEAVVVRSISYRDGDGRNLLRSVSFNGRDSETIRKPYGSKKMIFEGSLSFKGKELETVFSFRTPSADMENNVFGISRSSESLEKKSQSPFLELGNERYQAALKLQKFYKSFRTRRQLADCAVIVEQRWWKLLDFAELKRSSISFFDIEKPETAASRWSRARTRAAKVGKGLSKDEKARKLSLQHWLEAVCSFLILILDIAMDIIFNFIMLSGSIAIANNPSSIGEGKEVNLERCSRLKLQQQCIKYLGPTERKAYEVIVENGKFLYKLSRELLHTSGKDSKWIFVLSTSKTLYVGMKHKGTFQHSSFLAGGATLSAGRLIVENGILKAVWSHSGHYLPTEENFEEFMSFLREHNVDLTNVKKSPSEEEEEALTKSKPSQAESSTDSCTTNPRISAQEKTGLRYQDPNTAETPKPPISRLSRGLHSKITKLKIPETNVFDIFKKEAIPQSCRNHLLESPSEDGYETAEESFLSEEEFMVPKVNLFDEDQDEEEEEPVPKEKIIKRIDSHKGLKTYQLAKQLSSKWTTGAGPRISCMRDYPSELQFRVLEQANLSPRAKSVHGHSPTSSRFSPRVLTSTCLCRNSFAPDQGILSQTSTP